jgi:GAF domain-containing protein
MFLPMVLRGRVLGVIVVAHHEPGHFDAEDRVFGAAFAHQAAIEFENARLARDARMRADEVRTMLEVQQAIARRVDLQEVIRLIAQEARRLTVSAGALLFLREEGVWSLAGAIGHSTHRPLTTALQPVDLQDTLDALVKTGGHTICARPTGPAGSGPCSMPMALKTCCVRPSCPAERKTSASRWDCCAS